MILLLLVPLVISQQACYIPEYGGAQSSLFMSPVSKTPLSPPGVMPVVILKGSPYEMGYQYGLQVPEYIAIVRDAAWASALSNSTYSDIIRTTTESKYYIKKELPDFDFIRFFQGMSDAMNRQGYPFSPVDSLVILHYGSRRGPAPEEHCSAFAVNGNGSGDNLITGVNFDYYMLPSNSYSVLLALYPDRGYSCIIPSGAGRVGSNAVTNEKGLVYQFTSSPNQAPGDTGPGVLGFLELPYIGMTAGNVTDGENTILSITRTTALNRLLADSSGKMELIEATRQKYAIRSPSKAESGEYIITTNHYLDPVMNSSQNPWDPLEFYPSSYYRFNTIEKIIKDHAGEINYSLSKDILSSTDWWDGERWHVDDPFSSNTVNRFSPHFASLYSMITIPYMDLVSICLGNPGIPLWGTMAPGQTGTYVNLTVGNTPETLVFQLRSDADRSMWESLPSIKNSTHVDMREQWDSIKNLYWEGVWWHDRAILEKNQNTQMVAFGKAATAFSQVIAYTKQIGAFH